MTAMVRNMPTASVDVVAAFELRCAARARLFAEGELDLHEAVDVLQEDAVRDGLAAALGQDRVQAMMAEAFGAVRKRLTAWDVGAAYGDHRGVLDAATVAELDELIVGDDLQQFQAGMARLSVAEREAVNDVVAAA